VLDPVKVSPFTIGQHANTVEVCTHYAQSAVVVL